MKKVLILSFLTILVLSTGFIIKGFISFKKSEVYQFAKDYVASDPEVKERIGNVTGFGFMVGGKKSAQKAHLSFSVAGDEGETGIIIDLHKEEYEWEVDSLYYY
jgi:hypothetical protein